MEINQTYRSKKARQGVNSTFVTSSVGIGTSCSTLSTSVLKHKNRPAFSDNDCCNKPSFLLTDLVDQRNCCVVNNSTTIHQSALSSNVLSVFSYNKIHAVKETTNNFDKCKNVVSAGWSKSNVSPGCNRLQQLHENYEERKDKGKLLGLKIKCMKTELVEITERNKNEIERINLGMSLDVKERTAKNIKVLQAQFESLREKTNISKTYNLLYASLPTIYWE